MVSARIRFPGDDRDLTRVDVALVMESTYPFLKGGVSAVVHDIICHNPDITFGIIHTTWDSGSPLNDLYGMPANVLWVDVIYLSLEETRESFGAAMSGRTREKDAERLYHALELGREGDSEPLLSVYDDLVNPLTRKRRLWPALQTKATMERVLSFVGHAADICAQNRQTPCHRFQDHDGLSLVEAGQDKCVVSLKLFMDHHGSPEANSIA